MRKANIQSTQSLLLSGVGGLDHYYSAEPLSPPTTINCFLFHYLLSLSLFLLHCHCLLNNYKRNNLLMTTGDWFEFGSWVNLPENHLIGLWVGFNCHLLIFLLVITWYLYLLFVFVICICYLYLLFVYVVVFVFIICFCSCPWDGGLGFLLNDMQEQ